MKTAVILQPSYIPWLGYFEQMFRSDSFVYLDDVQYTKNDWRNRNRIKNKTGWQWLTVPVTFKFGESLRDVRIESGNLWQRKQIQAIRASYGRSSFFDLYFGELETLLKKNYTYLIDLDLSMTTWITEKIGLDREISFSSKIPGHSQDRQFRLVELCGYLDCDGFYEGKSGQNYMDPELFRAHGITVEFQEYAHPCYTQLWLRERGFISHLSVIDLLFNHGPDSLRIISREMTVTLPEGIKVRHADKL